MRFVVAWLLQRTSSLALSVKMGGILCRRQVNHVSMVNAFDDLGDQRSGLSFVNTNYFP